ncbi:hypothetical protein VHP8226_00150 [Vibrio hippocampi]|uniref:Uncharacterized protein n=2 Tax=Vibrio hippocampi TaxID=654686 RepID=A0ABM8ZEL0_9VIBR|nr:hypothetical protein VHP8226_00150 [Vibrio hippocampi]
MLAKDLSYAQSSFSFMGSGQHRIIQDEETFETKYDPYKAVRDYIQNESKKAIGHMKSGATSRSVGCLNVYHSTEFNHFISKQDSYIYN